MDIYLYFPLLNMEYAYLINEFSAVLTKPASTLRLTKLWLLCNSFLRQMSMSVWTAQVLIYGDQCGMMPACVIMWVACANSLFLVNLLGQWTCKKVNWKNCNWKICINLFSAINYLKASVKKMYLANAPSTQCCSVHLMKVIQMYAI